jgi:hypothetical protein
MRTQLDDRLFEALKGEMVPKFLATRDENGTPNVVPIISIQPYNRETLIFGNFLMWKTEKNLAKDDRVSVTVFTEDLFGATIRGRFTGFQRVGEYADIISSSNLMRYNAYTGIRNAGAIRIEEISEPFQLRKLDVLSGLVQSKAVKLWARRYSQGKRIMHPVVEGLYGRVVAVKVLSFLEEQGYPFALPLMSLQPAAPDVLVFSKRQMLPYLGQLRDGAAVASAIITMEPIAFQVKGRYRNVNGIWGAVVLDQAYHASPPYVGKRIA